MHKVPLGYAWRPKIFLYCYSVSALLVISLLWIASANIWRQIDEAIFFSFNGSLSNSPIWAKFWGYLNIHEANYAAGAIMVLILAWYFFQNKKHMMHERLSAVVAVALFVGLGVIVAKTGFRDFERYSPSLTLTPFMNLNMLIEGIDAKIQSHHSFPGDHGVTTLIYSSLVILLLKSRSLILLATLFALANNLPRLFSGAHWLSDVVVGGGAITLIILPFAVGTPILLYIEKLSEPLAKYAQKLLIRLRNN